jgi:hypothetical protein
VFIKVNAQVFDSRNLVRISDSVKNLIVVILTEVVVINKNLMLRFSRCIVVRDEQVFSLVRMKREFVNPKVDTQFIKLSVDMVEELIIIIRRVCQGSVISKEKRQETVADRQVIYVKEK